ncbi:MAG: dihydroneopterin aldolase [Acidobacteria bacterium]|nr:dihydroneopterin aldolase [Acidobacteriota bacterium]
MDKILVRGLKCELRIGVEACERRYPQICLVDIDLMLDLTSAAEADSVGKALDYARFCEEVVKVAAAREYNLVEAFANAVAEVGLHHEAVHEVRVVVEKTPLPLQGKLARIGVEICRRKGSLEIWSETSQGGE